MGLRTNEPAKNCYFLAYELQLDRLEIVLDAQHSESNRIAGVQLIVASDIDENTNAYFRKQSLESLPGRSASKHNSDIKRAAHGIRADARDGDGGGADVPSVYKILGWD